MNKEYRELAEEVAKETVNELKKDNMIKSKKTPFQKTEMLLYNYQGFLDVIKDKEEQIEEIRQVGLRKHSASVLPAMSNTGSEGYVKTEEEKMNEKILEIKASIATTRKSIEVIDRAIDSLRDEKYFDIIRMKYFEKKTYEQMAEYFHCDTRVISRQRTNLINKLQMKLFTDEVIREMWLS